MNISHQYQLEHHNRTSFSPQGSCHNDQPMMREEAADTQNGCHFVDDISDCIFLNKINLFWFQLHWSLVQKVRFIWSQHWFRLWLGALYRQQATMWTDNDPGYWRIYASQSLKVSTRYVMNCAEATQKFDCISCYFSMNTAMVQIVEMVPQEKDKKTRRYIYPT